MRSSPRLLALAYGPDPEAVDIPGIGGALNTRWFEGPKLYNWRLWEWLPWFNSVIRTQLVSRPVEVGMGRESTTREPQVLVLGSIYQGSSLGTIF